MPLTRHAYPVLQLAKFWFLTYVYVVDPGAELWPDKIVGLRVLQGPYSKSCAPSSFFQWPTLPPQC